MKYSPIIEDAINFAIKVHEIDQKQKRKGKDIPYITHPLTVGLILAQAEADEEVVAAGILHDTIEDCAPEHRVTLDTLEEKFGKRVAGLVNAVTEQNKDQSWHARKAAALEHVQDFLHDEVLIKSADVLANGRELVEDFCTEGESVWQRFNATKTDILKHYDLLIDALLAVWPESPFQNDFSLLAYDIAAIEELTATDKAELGSMTLESDHTDKGDMRKLEEIAKNARTKFGHIPKRLSVAGRPDLCNFPFNILFSSFQTEGDAEIMGSAIYEPNVDSFQEIENEAGEAGHCLTYFNTHNHTGRYALIELIWYPRTGMYEAIKNVNDKDVCSVKGIRWGTFFIELTSKGLYPNEPCKFEPSNTA